MMIILITTMMMINLRWPILMYLGLVFAAPYLIWRLLRFLSSFIIIVWLQCYDMLIMFFSSSLVPASVDNDGWAKGEGESKCYTNFKFKLFTKKKGEHYVAKALHEFSSDQSGEVNLQPGEMVRLAPRHLQPRVCCPNCYCFRCCYFHFCCCWWCSCYWDCLPVIKWSPGVVVVALVVDLFLFFAFGWIL